MQRLDTLLKSALLAGLALMFYAKLSDGTLTYYINQRFAWLSLVAVLLLAVLALTLTYRLLSSRRAPPADADADADADAEADVDVNVDVDVDVDSHSHSHSRLSWPALALVALPVVLGLLVPARPLGASAVATRGIGAAAPGGAGGATQAQRALNGPRNILDWLREFGREADPGAFTGQPVDVVGFVYRDPRNAADQFWVSRFAISCCAADAAAVGLLVQSEQAAGLQTDAWVRVTGTLSVGEFAGEKLPVIAAAAIEPTDQPEHPYLYP